MAHTATVIGGTGHVGTYLIPALVEAGYDVTCVSRGNRQPYVPHPAWASVRHVDIDRQAAEESGDFGRRVRELQGDVVIDMICFEPDSARQLVEALRGAVSHYLFCGTVWIHGHSTQVPTPESAPRHPLEDYGRKKGEITDFLTREAYRTGFPATSFHPGHIVGPGHEPINPEGHKDLAVFGKLARGESLQLPNLGMETVHHVHAEDVAQIVMRCLALPGSAVGESFHAVSSAALTLRGFAEAMAAWFGQPSRLAFAPFDEWKRGRPDADVAATWSHISHSPNCSIEKPRRLLGYEPRYTSLQAVQESVSWYIERGDLPQRSLP